MLRGILMTAPQPNLAKMMREVANEQGIEVEVYEGALENAVDYTIHAVNKRGIKVVISRGGTAALIKEKLEIPVITVEPTDTDLIRSIREAAKYGQKIGYLGFDYNEPIFDITDIGNLIGIKVIPFLYSSLRDVENCIEEAKSLGVEVIIGGGIKGVNLAEEKGLKGVFVNTSRRSVVSALLRAVELIRYKQKELEHSLQLSAIIDSIQEGIIGLNQNNEITIFNPSAERILNLSGNTFIGAKIDSLIPYLGQDSNNKDKGKNEFKNQIISLGDSKVLVNKVPFSADGSNYGEVIVLQEVSKIQEMEIDIRRQLNQRGFVAKYQFEDIIYQSKQMEEVVNRAKAFGELDSTVLIVGDSGTGKELFAQSIHNIHPKRKNGPFVAVNCAALPENLLESELFGYEHGAFTGAKRGGKTGLFELAHKGTIFLDEIDSIPLSLQARLLRVLQEKEVMRVGGEKVIPVDIRIIAATQKNLTEAVKKGTFRNDLYYRLNILKLRIPPLRERTEDIPLLVEHFLKKYGQDKNIKMPNNKTLEKLVNYDWPGGVRELENMIERYVVLYKYVKHHKVSFSDLLDDFEKNVVSFGEFNDNGQYITVPIGSLVDMENYIIKKLQNNYFENQQDLANFLGISRVTLWKKLSANKINSS